MKYDLRWDQWTTPQTLSLPKTVEIAYQKTVRTEIDRDLRTAEPDEVHTREITDIRTESLSGLAVAIVEQSQENRPPELRQFLVTTIDPPTGR